MGIPHFITQLGDFGLAKWKTTDDSVHTRILGTLGWDIREVT